MNKYEGMYIIKPDLGEQDQKSLFAFIADTITKNGGSVTNAAIWSEKRRLTFPIKKQQEGVYYLVNFTAPSDAITKLKYAYKLNETILRVMLLRV